MIGEAKEELQLKIRIPTPKIETEDIEFEEKSKIRKISWINYLFFCSCFYH
jgi:hypothetical protein